MAGGVVRNLIHIDHARLDEILDQIPDRFAILENARIKLGFSFATAKLDVEKEKSSQRVSGFKRIRRLEAYLERHKLLNYQRPRRMPHQLNQNHGFWWVQEAFRARKVILPTPDLLGSFGISTLTIWIAEPKRAPKPKDEWDWTGSFLYLPAVHYEKGILNTCMSGCSALQFVVNAAQDKPLLTRNWEEPFGRNSADHPIQKLAKLGAFVSDEQQLKSLYYVRYITDEQTYTRNGADVRLNDIVGYPIYIAAVGPGGTGHRRNGHGEIVAQDTPEDALERRFTGRILKPARVMSGGRRIKKEQPSRK